MNVARVRTYFCTVFAALLFAPLGGCSSSKPEYIVVGKPAPVPEGVVRYCWEEPIVAYQKVDPGIGDEGTWYYPAHVTERQVRGGKWRPCKEQVSETISGE